FQPPSMSSHRHTEWGKGSHAMMAKHCAGVGGPQRAVGRRPNTTWLSGFAKERWGCVAIHRKVHACFAPQRRAITSRRKGSGAFSFCADRALRKMRSRPQNFSGALPIKALV